MRLDKWLKVSRLVKRRTVANNACDTEKVWVNGRPQRASYDVKPGDRVDLRFGAHSLRVEVLEITEHAPKDTVSALYRELPAETEINPIN